MDCRPIIYLTLLSCDLSFLSHDLAYCLVTLPYIYRLEIWYSIHCCSEITLYIYIVIRVCVAVLELVRYHELFSIDFLSNYSDQPSYLEDALDKMITYWKKWQMLVQKGLKSFQLSLVLNTEIDSVLVPVQGTLMWPKLATTPSVKFPLTMIGNSSVSDVHLSPLLYLHLPLSLSLDISPQTTQSL